MWQYVDVGNFLHHFYIAVLLSVLRNTSENAEFVACDQFILSDTEKKKLLSFVSATDW